jgi:hypothetical protein
MLTCLIFKIPRFMMLAYVPVLTIHRGSIVAPNLPASGVHAKCTVPARTKSGSILEWKEAADLLFGVFRATSVAGHACRLRMRFRIRRAGKV